MLLIAVTGLFVATWASYRSAPHSTWACESESAVDCLASGTFDFGELDYSRLWIQSIDVDSAAGNIVVSVGSPDTGNPTGESSGAAGIVDAQTGMVRRWLVNDASVFATERVAFSPDGSLVGVYVLRREASEVFGQLEVFDTSTGASVGTYVRTETSVGCSRLGFAPDNRLLQCNEAIIDIATGELVEQLDGENRYGVASSRRWTWGLDGTSAERGRDGLDLLIRGRAWQPGDPQELKTIAYTWRERETSWVSFDEQGSVIAVVETGERQPWHERWRTLHRSHSPSRLTTFEIDSDSASTPVGIGFAVSAGGWATSGDHVVVADEDSLRFAVFAVESA